MIGIRYSCAMCGLADVEVKLPYRASEQDVVAWMKGIVEPAVCADHAERSPGCQPEDLQNIKIPMPVGTQWVGGPVAQ